MENIYSIFSKSISNVSLFNGSSIKSKPYFSLIKCNGRITALCSKGET